MPGLTARLPRDLYRARDVRELDRRAIEDFGVPGGVLMGRAGEAVYRALRVHWPEARAVTVLCGGGNNAGDGWVVARLAHEAGLAARVVWLVPPDRLRGDAAAAAGQAIATGVAHGPFDSSAGQTEGAVRVDALLGTGLDRPVEGPWRAAIEALNGGPGPTVAVDVPSGLHADTGAVLGTAVRAQVTVTFIGLKAGLFTAEGPARTGQVLFDDLAVPPEVYRDLPPLAERLAADPGLAGVLAPRERSAHKGAFGHVLVVGGDHGLAGAARLTAEAAARVGAGLVTLATRPGHVLATVSARPEVMVRGVEDAEDLAPLLARATVVAAGPGLGRGEWGRGLWEAVMADGRPLVLDADALNLLAQAPRSLGDAVCTPHPGEAARLLGVEADAVQADRFAAAQGLAERYGGVWVLKGAGTLVAGTGRIGLCDRGSPGMASGGMGDALTGIIAGLLAQGASPAHAARLGVCLHGRAADLAARDGERGLLAGDLLSYLRPLVNPPATRRGPIR